MNPEESANLARWSVRVGSGLVALAGTVVIVFGLTFVAEDASQSGEMFDGLGTFIGLAVCAAGLVCLAIAGLAFWMAGRRAFVAGIVLCGFGVFVAAAGWTNIDGSGLTVAAPMILGGLAVAGFGFGAVLAGPGRTIDSPGGGYSR